MEDTLLLCQPHPNLLSTKGIKYTTKATWPRKSFFDLQIHHKGKPGPVDGGRNREAKLKQLGQWWRRTGRLLGVVEETVYYRCVGEYSQRQGGLAE